MNHAQEIVGIMLQRTVVGDWDDRASEFVSGIADDTLVTEFYRKVGTGFVRAGWMNFARKSDDPLFTLLEPADGE